MANRKPPGVSFVHLKIHFERATVFEKCETVLGARWQSNWGERYCESVTLINNEQLRTSVCISVQGQAAELFFHSLQ